MRDFRAQADKQHEELSKSTRELSVAVQMLQANSENMQVKYKLIETELCTLRTAHEKFNKRLEDLETKNAYLIQKLNETNQILRSMINKFSPQPSYAEITQNLEAKDTQNPINAHITASTPHDTVKQIEPTSDHFHKIIVLYGLNEYNNETEFELHDRIVDVFYNIADVDLTGYIEDLKRIGRRGWRRPIVMELLSKRVAKYLLSNVQFFKNSGLWISEYLNSERLEERKHKREAYLNKHRRSTTFRNSTVYQSLQQESTNKYVDERIYENIDRQNKIDEAYNHTFRL